MERKNRLKQKLEEKKQLLVEQEKILEDSLNELNMGEIKDIDQLVNEIEGNFNCKKMKKKKKKKKKKEELGNNL